MSSDVEDVTFLPGAVNSHKRSLYEPQGVEKCQQLVCSQRKAIIIVVGMMLFIFIIALIASLARPAAPMCVGKEPIENGDSKPKKDYIATDGSVFPWKNIRLPKDVIPQAYSIRLHPNLTTFDFTGEVDITLQATSETDCIVLHSKNLTLLSFDLVEYDKKLKITIKENKEYTANEQIYLKLKSTLNPMLRYVLTIKFNATLSSGMSGFYKSSYETSQNETRWIATTHFEPTSAREAFPCFDEPEFKATFRMSMVREPSHFSLFNTPRTRIVDLFDGNKADEFEDSVKMSTYLVAFVVCDYEKLSNNATNVTVSVYAPPELIEQARFALDAAADILTFYEDFFGVDYPMPKQDLIAIPDFAAGAMENWGLIMYRMTAMLYDPEEGSVANQQWVAVVVAHELAHQWFGNLVTMQWWNDLWLNEGFATFVEYLGTDHFKPEWRMMDQFTIETVATGMRLDSLSNSHPISVSVDDPGEINQIFDQISYDKGSSIIRMLESCIGRKVLQEGLKYYLELHQFNNAETDDLWSALSEKAEAAGTEIDVKGVMDTWTRQMGYPVVKVKRDGNKVTVSQERFLLNPRGTMSSEFESPYNYKWQIPLSYVTSTNTHAFKNNIWLKDKEMTFAISGDPAWLKFNVNMTGFYRVCYDEQNWEAIIAQLLEDHTELNAADRASLIDDAFALAAAGHLNIKVALDLTKYLIKEKEYVPWHAALVNLGAIERMLVETPSYKFYQDYVKNLISGRLSDLGWTDDGSHLEKLLRAQILQKAITLNVEDSVNQAKEMFRIWMEDGEKIRPNLKNAVYWAGISYGGEAEWWFVWKKFKEATVPSEQRKLMYALAATTDALRLNRYLHMSLNTDDIRKGDAVSVVTHVAHNPAGKVLAWRFVKQNWDDFENRYGSGAFTINNLIVRTANHFTTQYDYDEVKKFYEEHETGSGTRATSQALEGIELNIDWLKNNEEDCVNWLKEAVVRLPPPNNGRKRATGEL